MLYVELPCIALKVYLCGADGQQCPKRQTLLCCMDVHLSRADCKLQQRMVPRFCWWQHEHINLLHIPWWHKRLNDFVFKCQLLLQHGHSVQHTSSHQLCTSYDSADRSTGHILYTFRSNKGLDDIFPISCCCRCTKYTATPLACEAMQTVVTVTFCTSSGGTKA